MADVTVTVDSNGDADNPGVLRDETIEWTLATGATGPFSLNPPNNMFKNDDSPACFTLTSAAPTSPTYTVKSSAAHGGHSYTINNGDCPGKPKPKDTGTQTITVNTSAGHPHHVAHRKE